MPPPIALGKSDFRALRTSGALYVDKTDWIAGVLREGAEVQLYLRPRRFGKTLNLSTLRYFIERPPSGEDRRALFEGLFVWQQPEARAHFQQHPVLSLSFKDIQQRSWREAREVLAWQLEEEARRLQLTLRGPLDSQLHALCTQLAAAAGAPVALLIDEYDTPLLTAHTYGYLEEARSWFRGFFGAALKDNPALFKGVLTGVLRVTRESIFSGLNHLQESSLLHHRQATAFGFTEEEVAHLLSLYGLDAEAPSVQAWYNGYRAGDTTLYNPWSILCFLSEGPPCRPHWRNTSSNDLLQQALHRNAAREEAAFSTLVEGGAITRLLETHAAVRDFQGADLWGLLVFSGYLRAQDVTQDDLGRLHATLQIPNREVLGIWQSAFVEWLHAGHDRALPDLLHALFTGSAPAVERALQALVVEHLSFHDTQARASEAFYHAFTLGLLIQLRATHSIQSNRESGFGRSDVRICPRTHAAGPYAQVGVVLEFKRREGRQKLETLAAAARQQIETEAYAYEMEQAGLTVFKYGIAFDGKRVLVRA